MQREQGKWEAKIHSLRSQKTYSVDEWEWEISGSGELSKVEPDILQIGLIFMHFFWLGDWNVEDNWRCWEHTALHNIFANIFINDT